MNSSSRFQSAKNLQPARSLRTPTQNRHGPGNFGITPEPASVYAGGRHTNGSLGTYAPVSSNNNSEYWGQTQPSNGYSNGNGGYAGSHKAGQRRHDVLRPTNTSFGSNASFGSNSSNKEPQMILTFSSTTLTIGSIHEVYVSVVENGPKLFTIQLKASESALHKMMRSLELIPVTNLSRKPTLGMACIARFSEDQMLYRALIMGINVDSCLVSYVDYGNTETVQIQNLYEIPKEFLKHKIFSMRFTLSNVKALEDTNADISGIFSSLVLDKVLTMKVMPLEGPAFVQYCELYDQNENIFDKLLAACKSKPLRYPSAVTLDRDSSCMIIIRYIESCKQFYVHSLENAEKFESLMDQLAEFCRKTSIMNIINPGDPCAACLDDDECYRAEIVSTAGSKVKVRLVDYGNVITVGKNQIKRLSPAFVEQQPQVVECCLEGFQDMENDNLSTAQLEMLAENENGDRKQFKLTVSDIINGVAIVNLLDEAMSPVLNVSKRLLKLKNPAKFIKEQQQLHAQQKFAASKTSQQSQPVQYPNVPASAINTRNPFHSTTTISEVTNISQSSPPRVAENSEIIDLTNDDWVVGNAQPLGHHSSGYDQQYQQTSISTNNYGSNNHRAAPNRTDNNRNNRNDSQSSSKDYNNTSFGSAKKERFQRPDIPRFNKDRNHTPYYVEHDDRCEESINYENRDNRSREKTGGVKSRTSGSGSESGFNTQSTDRPSESFKSSTASIEGSEDYVLYDHELTDQIIPMNTKVEIKLTLWVSAEQFYVRMKDEEDKYEEMMKQIQKFYKNRPAIEDIPPVGSTVIVYYQKHNTWYRARVLKYNDLLGKFKMDLIDCGNKLVVTSVDLWKLERRFAKLPKMAIQCTLANIKMNCDVKDLQNKIDKYIGEDKRIEGIFLDKFEDKLLCDVEVEGEDLKMSLLKDNLIAQILTDIDLNRLKGQTLKLKLVELKSLDKFRVKLLGHDAILNCRHVEYGAYDQSIVDEIRSKFEDQYCYGHIEDVSNDERLILTLLIPPLSTQTPPTIVNMPILQNKFNAFVTYVHDTNCVYVQNSKWSPEIGCLLDNLYDYYEKSGEVITNLQMDELCASKSSDGNWYRSKIVSLQEIDNIEVIFVDYGNRERVKHEDLKVLEPQFREYSAFAHRVYLPMACLNEDDRDKLKLEIANLTGEYELELKVLDYRNNIWIVDIASNEYSVVQAMKDKLLAKDLDHEEIVNRKSAVNDGLEVASDKPVEDDNEQKYQKLEAYVSHVDNPGQLFIQMKSDVEDLDQLQENLQIIAQALPQLQDFSVNRYCIAPYSADDLWYRARIIDSHDDLIIQFIDFGNSDVITSNKKCDLKDVNESLMKFKIYAKQCALLVTPPCGKKSWSEEATMILREVEEAEVQFLSESQGLNYINLKCGERDLAEELVAKQLAVKMEYVPSGQRCFTSHIESINEFYLQLERDINPLDTMADYMARYEEFSAVEKPESGAIYVAEFPEDGLWYRAKVLNVANNKDNEFKVFFLDYGNTSIVTNLRELEKSIAELPPLCTKCTMKIPEGVKMWSDEAENKFKEIAAMGETVFVVQLCTPGAAATVELFLDDKNVNEQLMDLCEKGTANIMNASFFLNDEKSLDDSFPSEGFVFVSHVNSPADFYLQFKNSIDALKNMEELLMTKAAQCDRLTHDEIYEGMFCLAYLVSYDKYYRAQIISATNRQYKVQLIDYGFTSFATDLRKMPDGIEQISLLAKKCCLEMYSPNDNVLDVVQQRFVALTDSGRTKFSFEIVRNDCEPNIIRLFTEDGRNVEDLLESADDSKYRQDSVNNNEPTLAVAPPPPIPADLVKTARTKPKQAFFRAKSDLEFEQ